MASMFCSAIDGAWIGMVDGVVDIAHRIPKTAGPSSLQLHDIGVRNGT